MISMRGCLPLLRIATLASALAFSTAASAQLFQQQPPRPVVPRATAPAVPGAPPAPRAAAPSPRAASCHGGASFDKFLADLKQRAMNEGVSQRTLAAAAP